MLDTSSIFEGTNSRELAEQAGYLDDPIPPEIQRKLKVGHRTSTGAWIDTTPKTLRELYTKEGMVDDANEFYKIFQLAAEKHLKALGYKGASWSDEDEVSPKQYQIWDRSAITSK
jgi:hypothetical protein